MSLPPDLLHRTPEEAARRIALSFLDEAHAAALRLDDPEDGEALHDFRVAIRRLRSTVRAWKDVLRGSFKKRHRRALKALQAATGGGRDAEVAVAWLQTLRGDLNASHRRALDWTIDRLERRHREAMAHVVEDVRKAFDETEGELRSVLEKMQLEVDLSAPDAENTYAAALAVEVRDHVDDLVRCLSDVGSLEDREQCHQSRIRGKRLRYLVEPIRRDMPEAARIVKMVKRYQDVLGDLNDAHVLGDELGRALEDDAVEQARRLHELASEADPDLVRQELRRSVRPGLLELTRRVRQRGRALFDRLEKEWLADSAGKLVQRCERLSKGLEQVGRPPVEIERKYLLKGRPELPETAVSVEIDQGWLPGDELQERLRCIRTADTARYLRTVKLGQGIQRIELEEETTEDLYTALWVFTEGCRVRKRRHTIVDGDHEWEVDEFLDRELHLAEVELDDPDLEVEPPAWLAPYVVSEVTGDAEYVNRNLAR